MFLLYRLFDRKIYIFPGIINSNCRFFVAAGLLMLFVNSQLFPAGSVLASETTLYFGGVEKNLNGGEKKIYVGAGNAAVLKTVSGNISSVQYLYSDHLDSSSVIADDLGKIASSMVYYPFGKQFKNTAVSQLTDKLYTSQRLDFSDNLYYYNARYYNPQTSHFICADKAEGPNRYAYVRNNPVMKNDPSGQKVCEDDGKCYSPRRYQEMLDSSIENKGKLPDNQIFPNSTSSIIIFSGVPTFHLSMKKTIETRRDLVNVILRNNPDIEKAKNEGRLLAPDPLSMSPEYASLWNSIVNNCQECTREQLKERLMVYDKNFNYLGNRLIGQKVIMKTRVLTIDEFNSNPDNDKWKNADTVVSEMYIGDVGSYADIIQGGVNNWYSRNFLADVDKLYFEKNFGVIYDDSGRGQGVFFNKSTGAYMIFSSTIYYDPAQKYDKFNTGN